MEKKFWFIEKSSKEIRNINEVVPSCTYDLEDDIFNEIVSDLFDTEEQAKQAAKGYTVSVVECRGAFSYYLVTEYAISCDTFELDEDFGTWDPTCSDYVFEVLKSAWERGDYPDGYGFKNGHLVEADEDEEEEEF